MKTKLLFLALPTLAALLPLSAQAAPKSINARQHQQQTRIYSGVRNGSLTPRETYNLEKRQATIASQEARDRRDGGKFTAAERLRIQRELNKTSRTITHQEHDWQGSHHPATINTRQGQQQWRIRQGVHSGSLTPSEAHRLQAREAWLRQVEAHNRRTGHRLTATERHNLERRLNNTSQAIYQQKHDGQHR